MSREKDLVKNTFILSLGRLLPKLVQVITLPLMTACLTKSEYGLYDWIATLIMLLMPIATLQIQSAAFRFLIDCRKDQERAAEIVSNIFAVVFPVSLVVSIGIVAFYPSSSVTFRSALGFYFFWDSLETTIAQVARGLGNNKAYSFGSIIVSWINGIGIVLALKLAAAGLLGIIISLGISNFIAFVYFFWVLELGKYVNIRAVSKKKILELMAYSWPMIPNNLSNWILKLSDRLVITAFIGLEATAVYGVANKIPAILAVANTVMTNAWQESASIAVKDEDSTEFYSEVFDVIFCLLIGFTALLIGLTPIIFRLLIRGDYEDAYIQMPILILAMFFHCMAGFQGGIYVAHKKTKSVGLTTLAAAVINLLVDFLLVNRIGITAGSLSTLIAYFSLYLFRAFNSRKFQPIKIKAKKQGALLLLITIMLFMCFAKNFYLNCINMIVGICTFAFLNKDLVKNFLSQAKQMVTKKST